jgi:hypothetical protein
MGATFFFAGGAALDGGGVVEVFGELEACARETLPILVKTLEGRTRAYAIRAKTHAAIQISETRSPLLASRKIRFMLVARTG